METGAKLSGELAASIAAADREPSTNASPLEIPSDSASWKKLCGIALRGVDRMLSLELKILQNEDTKYIHDFRVAARRLEQALILLSPSPMPHANRRLRRTIKRSRRALSETRNCGVLIEWSKKQLARKQTAHRPAWELMQAYLRERQADARARGLRKLTKLNLAKVRLHLRETLQPPTQPVEDDQAAPPEADYLVLRLTEELRKNWQRFEKELTDSQRSPDAECVHRARIATKRLRYLVEIMREFQTAGCDEVVAWLRGLQRWLGGWHDQHVLEQMMAEALARPPFLRSEFEAAWELMKLMRQNRRSLARFRNEYPGQGLVSQQGQRVASWVSGLIIGD